MDKKIQHYCLQWHNHHNDVAEVFLQLLQADSMVDVTLCAEGRSLYAHRMILSICSPFFQVNYSINLLLCMYEEE